jgi:hypothetical protein
MSIEGEFRRMPASVLDDIRARPEEAYHRVIRSGVRLELERSWERMAGLLDRARFPVNPVTAGEVFPDEDHAFGREFDSRMLTADQVAAVAEHLAATPFEAVAEHVRPLLDTERWEHGSVDPETEQAIRDRLAGFYRQMTAFFGAAAEQRECTVFWAE